MNGENYLIVGDYEGAAPVVNGSSQQGRILKTRGWQPNGKTVLRRGNHFTIQGVYNVIIPGSSFYNLLSDFKKSNYLKTFVVVEDVIATAEELDIHILPELMGFDLVKENNPTVWETPSDGAPINIMGNPREKLIVGVVTAAA
jgi:hypothetical protein